MIRIYELRVVSSATAKAQRVDFDPELDIHLTDMLNDPVSGNRLWYR